MARGEIRFRGELRKLVPWAHQLTVVAAEDAVADGRTQVFGNAALELNGQIGNAAFCVQSVRPEDGLCRACVNAARARAAM